MRYNSLYPLHYWPLFSPLCAGCDHVVVLWNVACGEAVLRIDTVHTDLIYGVCWNRDGSKILTSCKDKTLRVIDPRTGAVLVVGSPYLTCNISSSHCSQWWCNVVSVTPSSLNRRRRSPTRAPGLSGRCSCPTGRSSAPASVAWVRGRWRCGTRWVWPLLPVSYISNWKPLDCTKIHDTYFYIL